MLRRFLYDESGVSRIEYGLYLACFGVWCVIALETMGEIHR